MSSIQHREEFLFIYDVTDANPNGDPMDENKPRIDEETSINIVTDVRLKRTIRDFLFNYKGHDGSGDKDIFVRTTESAKGGLKDGKERAGDFKNDKDSIIQKCVDIRLFGGVLPLDKDSIKFTGPVQLKMGRSLHQVQLNMIQGTGAFAGTAGKKQQTFRTEYVLPYSLIAFYGVINENAAKSTGLSESDVEEFYEAMWEGTKNLISRSKMGHMPRLLLKMKYRKPHFFIGDLDRLVKLQRNEGIKGDEKIRSINDFVLDLSAVNQQAEQHKDNVAATELITDGRIKVTGWNQDQK